MAPGKSGTTRRDRQVRAYVRRELHAHTEGAQEQFATAQIDAKGIRSQQDLAAIPPMSLSEAGDGSRHLVRPTRQQLLRAGSPVMRLRTAWASNWGSWRRYLAVIEPSYRPVHYFTADGVAIGASAKDLVRLAALGAQWLRSAGVRPGDRVGLLEGANSAIEPWELSGGTRRAGVALAVVEDPSAAAAGGYSVIAGRPAAIVAALRNGAWTELRVALVFGRAADDVAARLERSGASEMVAVRRAFAVPGSRSVWFECVGGANAGWHTTAAAELVERGEDDEALWTGLGWAGTVFMRLRTGVRVAAIDDAQCPSCGHTGPRLFLADGDPALARWLRDEPRVAEFRLTEDGADVLPTRAGANARLVSDARKAFPNLSVTVKTKRAWQP